MDVFLFILVLNFLLLGARAVLEIWLDFFKLNRSLNLIGDGKRSPITSGAGQGKRIYAIPDYTKVKSLDVKNYPFIAETWVHPRKFYGATNTYPDEILIND
ncbi:MAG: alpha-D-ribose 1-methylphosphonate 5-phosphate C-P-lyase PhnJ [Cyanobacteria bacterium P01_F01_bin.150]